MELEYHQKINALKHWKILQQAHWQARRWNLSEALANYQRISDASIERYFTPAPEKWGLDQNEENPSSNWACVYLCEYCILNQTGWAKWRKLGEVVFNDPNYASLPDKCRSRLISTQGWADLNRPGSQMNLIIEVQQQTLDSFHLNDFEKALHHNLLGAIYQRLRLPDLAFQHLELATKLVDPEEEPFYAIDIKETLASTYYYLNSFDTSYYDKSIELYGEILNFAEQKGQKHFIMRELYNMGWVYVEIGQLTQAWDYFNRAYKLARQQRMASYNSDIQSYLDFEAARYLYGKGYALIRLNEIEEGIALLCEAASSFNSLNNDLMTAMSLQLVASGYQSLKKYDVGLSYAERSLDLQRRIDSPVQLYHSIQRMMELHCRSLHPKRCWEYFLEYRELKKSLRK